MLDNTAGPQKPIHGSCQEFCLPLAAEATSELGHLVCPSLDRIEGLEMAADFPPWSHRAGFAVQKAGLAGL